MKIALYIEDGLEQIVLTPESDTERSILAKIHDGSRELAIKHGSFYECRGGWMRHRPYEQFGMFGERDPTAESTMIVLRPTKPGRSLDDVFDEGGILAAEFGEPQPVPQEFTGTKPGVSMGVSSEATEQNVS